MSLHTDWAAAKKEAFKQFKDAQKNWLKKQDAKINATKDPKARKKALDAVLDDAGLEKGESLDDYLKFSDGFGKSLDELEKGVLKNQAAAGALNGATLAGILADKNLLRVFLAFCQRSGNAPDVKYYMADYKKSPQVIWDTYVKHGAPDQIDISNSNDHSLFQDWMAAGGDQQLLAAQGKSLSDRLRDHVENDLKGEVVRKFIANADVKRQLGIIDLAGLKKDVLDTAEKYNGQIERAVAKWKKLQPQFWTPLDESLQAIIRYVNAN
jgi:hypothetical protein